MDALEASILIAQLLKNGRINAADVLALGANPGLTHYVPCKETTLLSGSPAAVLIAPDGTPCELLQLPTGQYLRIGDEFRVEGKIEVIVSSPVPVYRVENETGIWAVIVFDGHPTQLKVKDVRTAHDNRYFITRDDEGDTLWALWNNELRKALQAPTIVRVHNKVLMEYGRDEKHWIQQYACSDPDRRWEVHGRLISAAMTPMGMLVAILQTEGGHAVVRGEDGVVESRHSSPRIRSEVHGQETVMLDGIGTTLFSGRSSVACLVQAYGRQDTLVIEKDEARLLGQSVTTLDNYPLISTQGDGQRLRPAVLTRRGNAIVAYDFEKLFVSRDDIRILVAEDNASDMLMWGENLEHRALLRQRGRVDPQHFVALAHKSFHKLVCAQRVANEYVLTDGHVQYGEPFSQLLKLEPILHTGNIRAWVLRGHDVVRLEATVIAY